MIRIVLILLLIVSVFIGLVLFPDFASQPVRIEMLGWLFETRTGMFILLTLLTLSTLWFLQKIFNFGINSPKQMWLSLRSGSQKRRDIRLQEALATWVDEGAGSSQKLLKRSKGVVPNWLHETLLIWWDKPVSRLKINDEKDSPLMVALKARLATEGDGVMQLGLSERQHYLDAWLAAHPAAPLALQRKAALLGELGDFPAQVQLLENLIQKNKNITLFKTWLADALYHLAEHDDENKLEHLRKANRLNPDDATIITALAQALNDTGDFKAAERLLLSYLEKHDHMPTAQTALKLFRADALKNFKQVDKPAYQNTVAGSWLRLMLAHEANLVGIAEDGLQALLKRNPSALLWQTRGDWFAAKQEWERAVTCYQKASLIS